MELHKIKSVLNQFQTPCYVFDLDLLKDRMNLIKEELGENISACYAMKANPFLIKPMNEYTDKYEVCSPGEYEICYRAGIAPEKIVISGVNKNMKSMERILDLSKAQGVFTIESEEHYRILSALCEKYGTHIKVLLRLSSGNQFGMDQETLEKVLVQVLNDSGMEMEGIHFYSGTQKKLKKIEKELTFLEEYAVHLRESYGISMKELEYGPGLLVSYFESEASIDAKEQLQELRAMLDNLKGYEHITIEMGRFIATCCGYYFTEVVDVKHTQGVNYAIVDGGIHQLNYYGQIMGMKRPHLSLIKQEEVPTEEEMMPWNVCGSLCTVNDVILKGAMFPMLSKGDSLVFEDCGAYSVTEGMALFLSRELPQIIFYSESNGFVVVREPKETNEINS